jgi:hemoglobin-like flavoprotein
MNAASLERLRASYVQLAPRIGPMTARFYDALFALRPELRALFTGDMAQQRRHLAAALALVVRNLCVLDALEQPLGELGAAHARVGVRPEHYPVVCNVLLRSICEELGDRCTPEVSADWQSLLETVARHMLAGSLAEQGRGR